MRVIIVSGSVCTGKTTLAKKLARKHGYNYIDLNKLIIENGLYSGYDKKLKTRIMDINKVKRFLIRTIKKYNGDGLVIDSHMSHYLPAKYVDICIITKTSLRKLKKRLEKRNYSRRKIEENMQAEILDVCLAEALENKHNVKVVNT